MPDRTAAIEARTAAILAERHKAYIGEKAPECPFCENDPKRVSATNRYRFKIAEVEDWDGSLAAMGLPDDTEFMLCFDCADFEASQLAWDECRTAEEAEEAAAWSDLAEMYGEAPIKRSDTPPAYKSAGEKVTASTVPGYDAWKASQGHQSSLPAVSYVKQCDSPHYTKITGPKGYGYLRLVSERGGIIMDEGCDYAVMLSSGWKRIWEPQVTLWTPDGGKSPPVPDLSIDVTKMPSIAVVEWPDMGPPTPTVMRYVEWVWEQWSHGKNIQFGCFGAHGRTGTFLALLYLRAGIVKTAQAAIELVHEKHCKDAVESKAQEEAIETYANELAGVKADE